MGNNLNILYKNKIIAALARKHNFTFYGDQHLPDADECEKQVNDARTHVMAVFSSYATWLATQEEDKPLTEYIDDIVTSVKDLLETFEYDVMVAGRNWVIQDILDEVNTDIEILDDYEVHKRHEDEKKKERCMEKLRKQMLIDKAIKDHEDVFDAVEDQTGEVDLDFEKDTLIGPEWECDDLHLHLESIEDIGYCRYCRDLEQGQEDLRFR